MRKIKFSFSIPGATIDITTDVPDEVIDSVPDNIRGMEHVLKHAVISKEENTRMCEYLKHVIDVHSKNMDKLTEEQQDNTIELMRKIKKLSVKRFRRPYLLTPDEFNTIKESTMLNHKMAF